MMFWIIASNGTINRELSALKRMLNIGAKQTPPKVDRVPYIPMLKENNTRKGFFEYNEFLLLRDALPAYLKGFVTFAYEDIEPKDFFETASSTPPTILMHNTDITQGSTLC